MQSLFAVGLLIAACALNAITPSAHAQAIPVTVTRATGSADHYLLYGSQVQTYNRSHNQVTGEFHAGRTTGRGHPEHSCGYAQSGYRNIHFVDREGQPVNYLELSGDASAYAQMFAPDSPGQVAISAHSEALIIFIVREPVLFELSGSVGLSGSGNGPGGGALLASAWLTLIGGPDIFRETFAGFGSQYAPFTGQGTLAPGTYFFEARAAASALAFDEPTAWWNRASYDLRITFSPIPAPGATALAAFCLPLMLRRRRSSNV